MMQEVHTEMEDASTEGSRQRAGEVHLAAISALDEMVEQAMTRERRQELYPVMLEHAGAALSLFAGQEPPWELARAHLVKAAVLADVAEDEENEQARLENVAESLLHCHQGLTILSESDKYHYQILSDAHAETITILLRLRALVEDSDLQQAIEGIIEAYSENLGTLLGRNILDQARGNDLLFMARTLYTLAEALDDSEDRLEVVQTAFETAYQAADLLWHTDDPDLAREACDLAEKAQKEVETLEATVVAISQAILCSQCGHRNLAANAFCNQCGASLQVSRPAMTMQSQGPICSVCHHQNTPGKKFCTRCGAPLG